MKILLNYLEIETCSLCNLACSWCPFGQLPDFRSGSLQFLETEYIEKLLNELKQNQFQGVISFHSMNEPLLDERITNGSLFRLCRTILSYHDVKIKIITNGILLDHESIERMLGSGLDRISVSCYEDDMLQKAKHLKKKYDEIEILDYTNEKASVLKFNRAGSIQSDFQLCDERKKTCRFPIFNSVVGFDGEIRLCCNDALGNIQLGNIKKDSLYDVLNSKSVCHLRNRIIANREDVFPCNVCNFEDMEDYQFDFIRQSAPESLSEE